MNDYPRNPQSQHSVCHFALKRLRTFAAFGAIFNGYRPPSVANYPRNLQSPHSIWRFTLKRLRTFAAFGGHFGWILTALDGRLPREPAIATFHLPFPSEMASFFCRLWGSFWIDIDHPQWATTPENPQSQTFHLPFYFKTYRDNDTIEKLRGL